MSKNFKKQEYHRYKRVGKTDVWRKPRGRHSKMREHRKGNPPVVDAGYGKDASERFLHPSGLIDVLVRTEKELVLLKGKKDSGARLYSKLSAKSKLALTGKAKELGITVFNPAREKKKKAEPKAEPKEEKK